MKLAGEVSAFLHEHVFEGDTLKVSTPFGDLVLPDDDARCCWHPPGSGARR